MTALFEFVLWVTVLAALLLILGRVPVVGDRGRGQP